MSETELMTRDKGTCIGLDERFISIKLDKIDKDEETGGKNKRGIRDGFINEVNKQVARMNSEKGKATIIDFPQK